jgi:hypothetical protein
VTATVAALRGLVEAVEHLIAGEVNNGRATTTLDAAEHLRGLITLRTAVLDALGEARAALAAPDSEAPRFLGYTLAHRNDEGDLTFDYSGPAEPTVEDVMRWAEPGDFPVAVSEVPS